MPDLWLPTLSLGQSLILKPHAKALCRSLMPDLWLRYRPYVKALCRSLMPKPYVKALCQTCGSDIVLREKPYAKASCQSVMAKPCARPAAPISSLCQSLMPKLDGKALCQSLMPKPYVEALCRRQRALLMQSTNVIYACNIAHSTHTTRNATMMR